MAISPLFLIPSPHFVGEGEGEGVPNLCFQAAVMLNNTKRKAIYYSLLFLDEKKQKSHT